MVLIEEEEEEEEKGGGREEKRPKTGGSSPSSLALTLDPDVLDCPICCEVLSPPIYQCCHGHITCSSCRTKVKNICPSCKSTVCYRCLAVEKIIESIKVPCPYASSGCEQVISYLNTHVHRKLCDYSPGHCPADGCPFEGPMRGLYHHFIEGHPGCSKLFVYNLACSVVMRKDEHFRVGHGEDAVLFLILNKTEFGMGNAVMVACLGPDSMAGKYTYSVKTKDHKGVIGSLQLESPMSNIRRWEGILPRKNFLLIPTYFDALIVLEITIWNKCNSS